MAEVWRAADRFDELAEAGYHVAFSPGSRGLRIELEDANGHTFRRLAPSEALDLAAGAPVA
jgi:hypothetical protein